MKKRKTNEVGKKIKGAVKLLALNELEQVKGGGQWDSVSASFAADDTLDAPTSGIDPISWHCPVPSPSPKVSFSDEDLGNHNEIFVE